MGAKGFPSLTNYKRFFVVLFAVLVVSIIAILIGLVNVFTRGFYSIDSSYESLNLNELDRIQEVMVPSDTVVSSGPFPKCSYYDCFNIYKCGHKGSSNILVYVYPLKKYINEKGAPIGSQMSKEFYTLLDTIVKSRYYTPNPEEACVFVVSIDTLNQNRFKTKETSQALALLPYWHNGDNHIVFNMISGVAPDFNTVVDLALGNAIVAGAGFDTWTYRIGFDISIPVFSPLSNNIKQHNYKRKWLVISSQLNIHPEYTAELMEIAANNPKLLVLEACDGEINSTLRCSGDKRTYHYPHILQRGEFCLVMRGARLSQPSLIDAMAAGCIPIVSADTIVMPFADVLDWRRAAIMLGEADLGSLMTVAEAVPLEKRLEMSEQCKWLYSKYFSSMETITMTTLDILNDRVYPQNAKVYEDWNNQPLKTPMKSPLFLEVTSPKWQGFTAVVLTYDRVDSLFGLIQKLVKVNSLSKVLVIWNNQRKSPPHFSLWPKVSKPLKVIQTKANKLSNRFYPYEEIETEAILTIDDDIVMLTADELEFGYEVWREFPDRIVGFPSRVHVWDNVTNRWKYESEWTNQISMVLTGAAFHHKYWSYMYTTSMPGNIKEWVDEHMNCEDIAMNFLVANVTNKAPIKVTPRKKFKCPECVNNEMLSADLNHMIERSNCIDRFATIYGRMPLRSVEFRADPVLYRDTFPEKLKWFNNIGSL
ncbi:exostosin-2 [Cimex lectularius]|uniref:Exostosin-2 n=1 Tax=Cimex lectularius TaxID=79782 RepID=A0A8I6SB14_CIMLE|nr:exostosin-2 [Cimex lectularius]